MIIHQVQVINFASSTGSDDIAKLTPSESGASPNSLFDNLCHILLSLIMTLIVAFYAFWYIQCAKS